MDSLQIFILSIVQGLTEFLPISSSAHLILAPISFGFSDQGLAFDVALHVGSLLAVTLYFRAELLLMGHDFFYSLGHSGAQTDNSRMAWMVIIATLPIVVMGKLLLSLIENDLRSISVIATTTIIFGLALYWADKQGAKSKDEYATRWKDALISA